MKIVGTIVEYNPLHNGHVYAINQIKKESQADLIIAVMSTSFTMRGDLSLFNKFEKTQQALKANIDLIIELPLCYTLHNSDLFAYHSIHLLNLAKVDEVWIGSESNNPFVFEEAYNEFKKEENQNKIKKLMNEGYSYKQATNQIYSLPSNDLLGYSYYKALKEINPNIPLKTIKRVGSTYFEETPKEFASAYAIRNNLDYAKDYCPSFININNILNQDNLYPYLKYQILTKTPKELKDIFLVEEGIENKLHTITNYKSYNDFISSLVSKRYTKSRIQRMLTYVLLNIKKDEMNNILTNLPNFLRILGYSNLGKTYLNNLKKETKIYTNIKNNIHLSLDIELKVSSIIDSIYNTNLKSKEQTKPIMEDK